MKISRTNFRTRSNSFSSSNSSKVWSSLNSFSTPNLCFELFEGVVAFELVFELFEGVVIVFELFDRLSTFRIGIFFVFELFDSRFNLHFGQQFSSDTQPFKPFTCILALPIFDGLHGEQTGFVGRKKSRSYLGQYNISASSLGQGSSRTC